MTIPCYVILVLLVISINCFPDIPQNNTIINNATGNMNVRNLTEDITQEISITNDSTTIPNLQNDISKIVRQIQPDQIKEDDKNGTDITEEEPEVFTMIAESLVEVNETEDSDNITASSVPPFSPSPYLGTVIEEVIEEPIAQHRDFTGQTNFIPMKSRQSFNTWDEAQLGRQHPTFQTSPTILPVLLGDSYALHADDTMNQDFDNPDFNENPFGRIKFPDEKSKYYPVFLNENEIDNQDKPLKFDYESNYKQYDFPYKIESAATGGSQELQALDKTVHVHNHYNNYKDNPRTVHGSDIMKNINKTSLPLEMKKSFPMKPQHTTWKKVAHTVMAFLPIGLMLAAIPPRVVKANSTNYYPA